GTGDSIDEAKAGGTDLIKGSVSIDLTAAGFAGQEIENVTLLNGFGNLYIAGNGLNNLLTGNDGIYGGAGADKMDGGDGNDAFNNSGYLADGAADVMIGGKGDDIYNVFESLDTVVETVANADGGGTDLVLANITFSLAALANVENVQLIGLTTFEALNATGN